MTPAERELLWAVAAGLQDLMVKTHPQQGGHFTHEYLRILSAVNQLVAEDRGVSDGAPD